MARMSMVGAINSAMSVMLERDPDVVVMGEDVGYFGGVFRCTDGLQKQFGKNRVFDTPLSEGGIVAAAIGMAANGLRPVVEIQFADYIFPAFDQIISELGRLRSRSGGQFQAPVVIRAPSGGGIRGGQTHSMSPEAYFAHAAGLKVVMPSNPGDAKGLLISAIEDDDPVIYFEPKRLYNGPFRGDHKGVAENWDRHPDGEVGDGHFITPIGQARRVLEGDDISILCYGTMVHVAAAALSFIDVSADLLDLRTIVPVDREAIAESVRRTGRCVIVHEAPRTCGFGAELSALVQEDCFWHLEAPILRVAGWDVPYPHAQEWDYFPGPDRIIAAIERTMAA